MEFGMFHEFLRVPGQTDLIDLYATGSFTRNLAVQGGYRRITANYVVDDDTGDLKLKGMYFGGLVRSDFSKRLA